MPQEKIAKKTEEEQAAETEGVIISETGKDARSKEFGSNKPEFKRPQECLITEAKFQTDNILVDKEKGVALPKDEQYKKHWINVKFKYIDKETKTEKFFSQTYGSIREYPDRLWFGTGNNLAKLKELLEAFISYPLESVWEMEKVLVGQRCSVKSESWEVGNNKGFSNKILDFLDEAPKVEQIPDTSAKADVPTQ